MFITTNKDNDNFKDIIRYLPLLAASKNQVDILRTFVPISCVNSLDSRNRTPLHYAAYYCQTDTVQFLLNETSIDHMLEDDLGYSAFQYSCVGGDTDIMDLILDKTEVNTDIDDAANREDISNSNFGMLQQESVPSFAPGRMMARPAMPPQMMESMAPSMPEMSSPMTEMAFQTTEMAPPMMRSMVSEMATPVMLAPEMAPPPTMMSRAPQRRSMQVASPAMEVDGPYVMTAMTSGPSESMLAMREIGENSFSSDSPAMLFAKSNKAMRANTGKVTEKKKENIPKKFFLQSLIVSFNNV